MKKLTINLERKVWGAPDNDRADHIIAYTSHISRDADNYGAILNADLPEDYASVAMFMRRSRTLTVTVGQGAFTRFEGQARSYNMRVVYEVRDARLGAMARPLEALLPHLNDMHPYEGAGNQVESAVEVDELSAVPLTPMQARLQSAMVTALMTGRKLYVRLPEADAQYGGKVLTDAPHLRDFLAAIDDLPEPVRPCASLVFGVNTTMPTFREFIAMSLVVAHFNKVEPTADALTLDLSSGTLQGSFKPALTPGRLRRAAARMPKPDEDTPFESEAVITALNEALVAAPVTQGDDTADNGVPTGIVATDGVDAATDEDKRDEDKRDEQDDKTVDDNVSDLWRQIPGWARYALAGLLGFIVGLIVGRATMSPQVIDTQSEPVAPDSVVADSVAVDSLWLIQQFADNDKGDKILSQGMHIVHPMVALAEWNLDTLYKSLNVYAMFLITLNGDTVFAESTANNVNQKITKKRVGEIDSKYYSLLDSDFVAGNFATAVQVVLSDGKSYDVTPTSTFFSISAPKSAATLQVKGIKIGNNFHDIDNEDFKRVTGGDRTLNYVNYYLWVVEKMDSIRQAEGMDKLIAY